MYHPTLLQAVITLSLLGATLASTVRSEESSNPAQSYSETTEVVDGLPINRIDHIEVVDRQTLLFYLSKTEVYVNRLPKPCPGLNKNSAVLYKTSQSELTNLDMVTVLHSGGSDMQAGATCGLGRFEAITADEAKALKDAARGS